MAGKREQCGKGRNGVEEVGLCHLQSSLRSRDGSSQEQSIHLHACKANETRKNLTLALARPCVVTGRHV